MDKIDLSAIKDTGVKNKSNKLEHVKYLLKREREIAKLEMEFRDELIAKNRVLYSNNYKLRKRNRELKELLKLNNIEHD